MKTKEISLLSEKLKKIMFIFAFLSLFFGCFGVFLSKQNISQTDENTLKAATEATIYGGNSDSNETNSWHYRIRQKFGDSVTSQITSIVFNVTDIISSGNIPNTSTSINEWTVVGDGIYGYFDSSSKKLTFATNNATEKIYLPQNSNYLFSCGNDSFLLGNLQSISGMQYLDTGRVNSMVNMFYGCASLVQLDVSGFDTSNVLDMGSMFYNCSSLQSLDVSNFNTEKVTDMFGMFYNCAALQSIDVSNFKTQRVTDMGQMFYSCKSIKSLDVSKFNTSKVGNMMKMFSDCVALENLDVSLFDTALVSNMSFMFSNCQKLTSLNVSNFSTSNTTEINHMFNNCNLVEQLDVSNFNTTSVTKMNYMFSGCRNLTTVDVSNFNTASVTDLSYMFSGCTNLTSVDVSNFVTSRVTNFRNMFNSCEKLDYIDVADFNTSNAINFRELFSGCTNLRMLDLTNWDMTKVTDVRDMLKNCSSLCAINIPQNISTNTNYIPVLPDKFYNRIDKNDEKIYFNGTYPYSYVTSGLKLGKAFQITFNQNGAITEGTTSAVAIYGGDFFRQGLADDESAAIELTNPIGSSTFIGWSSTQNASDIIIDSNKLLCANTDYTDENGMWRYSSDVTLFANWGERRKSITFNLNGAPGTAQIGYVNAGQAQLFEGDSGDDLLNLISPEWNGRSFDGWSTEESDGTLVIDKNGNVIPSVSQMTNNNSQWLISSDIVLYAIWTPCDYTITFEKHGGVDGDDYVTATFGESLQQIVCPSFVGFAFSGYYTEENGKGTQYYSSDGSGVRDWDIDSTVTLHAFWSINSYTIQFESNGGDDCDAITANYGESITLPSPTKQGYTFDGWFDKQIGEAGATKCEWDKMPALENSSIILYAAWLEGESTPYKVIHRRMDLNGEYTIIETQNLFGVTDSDVTPEVRTYEGFKSPAQKTLHVSSDGLAELTYDYERNKYTFTLGEHAGVDTTGSTQSGDIYFDAELTFYAIEKVGYTWKQWDNGNTNKNFIFKMPANAFNISPVAEPIEYSIEYILDQGTINTSKTSYNIESNLILDTPTRNGYTFVGWTGSNGDIPEVSVSIEAGTYGDKSYVANWQANSGVPYTVEHFKMDINGNYSIPETETLYGTTDEIVSPQPNVYIGFKTPTEIKSDTVNSDGSTVIQYYYERNKYKIAWNNYNSQKLAEDLFYFEEMPAYSGTPTRESDVQYEYAFSGWTPTVTSVEGDKTYTATFTQTLRTYKYVLNFNFNVNDMPSIQVNVNNNIQNLLPSQSKVEFDVTYGTQINSQIILNSDKHYNISWTDNDVNVIEMVSTTDDFMQINNDIEKTLIVTEIFEIKLNVNNDRMGSVASNLVRCLNNADDIAIEAFPAIGFSFVNWTTDDAIVVNDATSNRASISDINANCSLTANFEYITYKIILDIDGLTQEIQYNIDTEDFALPNPSIEDKEFDGWIIGTGNPQKEVIIQKGSTGDKNYRAYFIVEDENGGLLVVAIVAGSAVAAVSILAVSVIVIKKKKKKKPRFINLDKFKMK